MWSWTADPPTSFFAGIMSGAQRQPNGNTLICDGPGGEFFEVTPTDGETVWHYVNPIAGWDPVQQGGSTSSNSTFRAERYAPDYPGFDGRDLTPGDPIELYDAPLPVPDGMTVAKLGFGGLQLTWDAATCPSLEYNLIWGDLAAVGTYELGGSACAIGTTGESDWFLVPPGSSYFLIVGAELTGVYESRWGPDSSGAERNGTAPSNLCNVTTKITSSICR